MVAVRRSDPPDGRLIRDGYRVLEEIGAVGGDRRVSRLGRQLARLPVDPRIGRMLLAAEEHHCLHELLVIAAAVTVHLVSIKTAQPDQLRAELADWLTRSTPRPRARKSYPMPRSQRLALPGGTTVPADAVAIARGLMISATVFAMRS